MRLHLSIWFLMALLVTGCYSDDFFETNKDAFYKLYGNGTEQEAVAMQFSGEGDIYLLGNQAVRNQDSSAVVVIRTDPEGNQRWAARHFGKGYSKAKGMLMLPSGELLLLAASRPQDQNRMVPVLYRLDAAGNMDEFFLAPGENSKSSFYSSVPEDMVLDGEGAVFVLGNYRNANDEAEEGYIIKVNLLTGEVLDEREISNAAKTEAKQILLRNKQLLVIGDTGQERDDLLRQNIFMASFSLHLVPADFMVLGSPHTDSFHKAILSSLREFVILSSERNEGVVDSKGVVRFIQSSSLDIRKEARLEYNAREMPEAIEEDEEGNFYVALTTSGERGDTNILINRIDPSGDALWDAPKEIGGEGRDRLAQISVKGGYVYLLKTIDMQNENKLISLSRIRL